MTYIIISEWQGRMVHTLPLTEDQAIMAVIAREKVIAVVEFSRN